MFATDLRGILTLLSILLCWILAVWLFRVSEKGSTARMLSVLLSAEGFTLASSSAFLFLFSAGMAMYELYPWIDPLQHKLHYLGDAAMIALYPPFLAAALNTRLARPFGRKPVRIGLAVYAATIYILSQVVPQLGITLVYMSMSLLFIYALVVAIHAWIVSSGQARTRARIFGIAFGVRDICWGYIYFQSFRAMLFDGEVDADMAFYIVYILGTLIAVPIIAYGILRAHLFDIDLRIKWTIKQSTLAGIFVAVMFLISEGASTFLSAELGNVAGLLAAAVLMFFLAPLQRFAEQVSSAAMPKTRNTPEYEAFRKMQVYESAISEAMIDGGISPKERALLAHLRESLGISETDAEAIERDLENSQPA
ncbi:MAG: hypothetical protein KJO85_03530 [Gammaproteobacteria bacterium]|nr:hypothetical protein [Gammaproteobacteria bacterium]NNE05653.1 hypothetical protein [Xanthomonadales bacterium]